MNLALTSDAIASLDISRLSPEQQSEFEALLQVEYGHLLRRATPFSGPWDFLTRAVFTKDEASGSIRRFPADLVHMGEPRFGYLEYLTKERPQHKVRLYEKSRRMLITWWLIALYLYDLMTQPNELAAVASDKLGKSAYLLGPERMQFIYDHIPPVAPYILDQLKEQGVDPGPFGANVWPNKPEVRFEGKQGRGWELATCPSTGSSVMAMASGAAQMQQYTFRRVLLDEFARWQWQEESWRNIQPCIQGGGTIDIVTTPELGAYAESLAYDRN